MEWIHTRTFPVTVLVSDELSALSTVSTARDAGREAIHHPGESVASVTYRPETVGNAAHLRQQQQQLLHLQQLQQQQQQQTYAGVLRSEAGEASQAGQARQALLDPITRIRNLGTKGSHFSPALLWSKLNNGIVKWLSSCTDLDFISGFYTFSLIHSWRKPHKF